MFISKLAILFLFYITTGIEGHDHEFRFDYEYYEDAGGWLKLHKVPTTWRNARFQCRAEGAVLASPLTEELRDAMLDLASGAKPSNTIYTGIHSTYAQGVFTSVEGVPLSRIPITWSPQAPHNYNYEGSESCLVMMLTPKAEGTISDVKCSAASPYICYKKETQPPSITYCGTVDPEYKLYKNTGRCYKFHRYGLTWPNAFNTCVGEGGHLAVINSEEEFQVLREIFNNQHNIFSPHTGYATLGFTDPNDGSSWITVHGQTLEEAGFERWASGEPNNASQPLGELCGVMLRSNGEFNDVPCYWPLAFICEKDPNSLRD